MGISSAGSRSQGGFDPGQTAATGSGATGVHNFATVYVDGVRSGELDFLKTINTTGVIEVRFYTVNEAESEFGPRHEGGVIAVRTAKPGTL